MPSFLSKVLRGRDPFGSSSKSSSSRADGASPPPKPKWEDAWLRPDVEPDEVRRLIHACTLEVKSKALDMPFLLLPFRPDSDTSGAKILVRKYFQVAGSEASRLEQWLQAELRLTEPLVLCSVLKWCWARLPGGVVTWEAYELFKLGEQDSNLARDSFATFIPLSVDSDARSAIIFDFFDLMAAIAAHGKTNGLGGRKLSRFAGWWAFAHPGSGGPGFDEGYGSWAKAADATSHLFFAYLRSLSPTLEPGKDGILNLPRSLQALLQATEYPPETPTLMQHASAKVIMIVNAVSPTPFALLRRAKRFDYRDDDAALQAFAEFDDPVEALTDECRRIVRCISSANQSTAAAPPTLTGLRDPDWSRFQDMGFSTLMEEPAKKPDPPASNWSDSRPSQSGLRSTPQSGTQDHGRPTTPSWADFLSAGFVDASNRGPGSLLLPPDKVLPPLGAARASSLQSFGTMTDGEVDLEPGELASVTNLNLDAAFWWVWMTSLAGEEPLVRKSVFGRCAVIETNIAGGRWLVIEEKVKGAAPVPTEGARLVEKKSRFSLAKTRRGISWRGKAANSKNPPPLQDKLYEANNFSTVSKISVGPDQHARIQAAAAALQQRQRAPGADGPAQIRRARTDDVLSTKTNSVFTLQPVIMREAAPAMKWASRFDSDNIRDTYLADSEAGKGQNRPKPTTSVSAAPNLQNGSAAAPGFDGSMERDLPQLPTEAKSPTLPPPPPPPDQKILPSDMRASLQDSPALPLDSAPIRPMGAAALRGSEYSLPAASEPVPPPYTREQVPPSHPPPAPPAKQAEPEPPTVETLDMTPEARKAAKRLQKRGGGTTGGAGAGAGPTAPVAAPSPTITTTPGGGVGHGAAGFKKLFGMKAPDAHRSLAPPSESVPVDAASSQRPGLGRRLSALRRPGSPKRNSSTTTPPPQETASPGATVAAADKPDHQAPTANPAAMASAVREALKTAQSLAAKSPQGMANGTAKHDPAAQPAPARKPVATSFQAGPLEDVPAFVPDDSPDSTPSMVIPPEFRPAVGARGSAPEAVVPDRPVSPVEPTEQQQQQQQTGATGADDTVSEQSEEARRPSPPPVDRWAQIRKNAAERAARAGTDPSRMSPAPPSQPPPPPRKESSETSGEETIESRVARIKARVAELTANADDRGPQRPSVVS